MAFFPFLFSLFFFEETNSETSSEVEPLIKDSPITVRHYADWPLRDLSSPEDTINHTGTADVIQTPQ